MQHKKVIFLSLSVIIGVLVFTVPALMSTALSAEPSPTPPVSQNSVDQVNQVAQVEQAILSDVVSKMSSTASELITSTQVTEVQLSQDQQWATAWVVYYDAQVDAVLPTEPGMAIAHQESGTWQVVLPSDENWQAELEALPVDLMPQDEKDMWSAMNQGTVEAYPTQTGYFLPWHGGQTMYLSRSVGHDADYTTAHYAFDFFYPGAQVCTTGGQVADAGTEGLNFSIYAARAGTVWGWDDSVTDCDHSKVNFIVIRNIDDPTIFQLYMHLSKGSIPPALKSVGAPVARGQFLAVADNTGASTGSHLHFQIEHQPYWPTANPYWNTALDFTFADVDINGGRPRVNPADGPYCQSTDACSVFRNNYTSGNYYQGDSTPPTGKLAGVSPGQVVKSQTLSLSGWASDDQTGLDYGQLVANINGTWQNLGPHFNPSFTYNWDFCNPALMVPDGPVSIAMLLYDVAGNPAPRVGLTTFIKNYSCPVPPPSCRPAANQVTLFEDPDYQGGCVKFNVGNYPTGTSLNPLGNDDADSILVGTDVYATFYSDENYSGHSQTIAQDFGYLQYEWVPASTLSSMKVIPRSSAPSIPTPVNPPGSSVFRAGDVIPFSWRDSGGATQYRIQVFLSSTLLLTSAWQSAPVMWVDSLAEGEYSWQVQAMNPAGTSTWSAMSTFTIKSPIVYPAEVAIPYNDSMEGTQSKWTRDGYWVYTTDANKAHSGTGSWWYQNSYGNYDSGQPNMGSLTSSPIKITASGYYLRFYYRYETETTGARWDQRWVQVSVDGQPFKNLVQLSDDPQMAETTAWMQSKAIDLSAYSGHTIRIRFAFATLDASANNYAGWGIDDFTVTADLPSQCTDNRVDESPSQAYLLTYNPSIPVPGEICPNGDYDFYKFHGYAGDRIVADVDAMINGSPLDSYLYLLDTDGNRVLAENDDEIYATLRDPLLSYTLPYEGDFYLKLKAWKHPLLGGDDYTYTIRLYEDHQPPTAEITWPNSGTFLPDTTMTLRANVGEVEKGVDRVEFFWHPTDWLTGVWKSLGVDRDGSDGWSISFSPAGESEGKEGAVYAQVYDMAGNSTGLATWNLGIDKTPPSTQLNSVPATQPSNAFLLGWTGSDNLAGIDYVEIQQKQGAGTWTTFPPISGYSPYYWVIGNPGNSYSYRMHGIDRSGNTENYPTNAEAITSIPDASVICFKPDSYDVSGNDNSPANASEIFANGASQFHNFCNPLSADFQNDVDWAKLQVTQGEHYLIVSVPKSQPSATLIRLYANDGTTLLAQSYPPGFGSRTVLLWTSDRDDTVYLRFSHLDGRVIGYDVGSTIDVKTVELQYFPQINR